MDTNKAKSDRYIRKILNAGGSGLVSLVRDVTPRMEQERG